MQKLPILRNVS